MSQRSDVGRSGEKIALLQGGRRMWWDVIERRMVPAAVIYVPYGCPDWGETDGTRNGLCTFCAIPRAVEAYRAEFYGGHEVPHSDHELFFRATLRAAAREGAFHTLMIFNAGSFLAMPDTLVRALVQKGIAYPFISRIVIESRATLVTEELLRPLMEMLSERNVALSVRIGVETKNTHLRLKVLKKGNSERELRRASEVLRDLGVTSGGYALLNPAPGLDVRWAVNEAIETIDWILDGSNGLGMDEVYFGPTCVGPDTPLAECWKRGEFFPAPLWSVLDVLESVLPRYEGKVHLLPFVDEPAFLAVPSNHIKRGLPESLHGAEGCDMLFHQQFDRYRATMNRSVLYRPSCHCSS